MLEAVYHLPLSIWAIPAILRGKVFRFKFAHHQYTSGMLFEHRASIFDLE